MARTKSVVTLEDLARAWPGPLFPMWASAAVDEILSAQHERMVVGSLERRP